MSLIKITEMIPNCGDVDSSWIAFHKEAKSRYGRKDANILWKKVWDKRADETGVLSSDSANTEALREYMESQGINISGSAVDSVTEGVGDTFGFMANVGKTFWYITVAVVIMVLIAIILVIFKSVKDPSYAGKVAKGVASARSGGII